MKNNLWVYFAIIGGFMGFLLGYSTPPMMEVGLSAPPAEVGVQDELEPAVDEDLAEYYRQLQDLKE